MYKVGFTGTREILPFVQLTVLNSIMQGIDLLHSEPDGVEGHSGDCGGGDKAFHGAAVELSWRTVGHIPDKDDLRAFCVYDEVMEPKSYFGRNRDIVNSCDELLATPKEMRETENGGTWFTVNYGRSHNKPITIIWPDGSVTKENHNEANMGSKVSS
jgi:hypothetical protein